MPSGDGLFCLHTQREVLKMHDPPVKKMELTLFSGSTVLALT